jgi:hypothetical protein
MPDTSEELFSIVVFPYLKTSGPVRFGPYLFRSTDDLEGLSKAQVTAVTEVTAMLYTQNNARARSASYAVIPQIHVSMPGLINMAHGKQRFANHKFRVVKVQVQSFSNRGHVFTEVDN